MNGRQYEEVFGGTQPQNITGKLIELTFKIPNKWYKDYYGCSQQKVDRFERREIYTPEFRVSDKPITLVRIKPDCGIIHIAPSSFGEAHYDLTMLFDEGKFDELVVLFESQKGGYSKELGTFPKMRLPVELRQFDFLAE